MAVKTIWFSNDEDQYTVDDCPSIKYFSVAQDLKLEKRPIRQRYKLLLQDYMRFVQARKASLKSEDVSLLDQMLVLRFNNLINQVEDDIRQGKMLSQLLAITDSGIRKAADRFSREYKKLLMARENLGYIPKMNQEKVDDNYKVLIAELRKKVFAPVLNLFSWDPADLPESIELTDEEKLLLSGNAGITLPQLYNLIVGYLRSQNINAKVDLADNKLINVSLLNENDQAQEQTF